MKRPCSWREWLPNANTLTLIAVTTTAEQVVSTQTATHRRSVRRVAADSQARHSRYWRTLKDLPAQARAVTLSVRVSRWRCRDRACERTVFADRLVGVSPPRVHRTERCAAVVHLVGHALGGRGGERLLHRLGMAVSDDTILRLLKRPVLPPLAPKPLLVVGTDDWAWQKGQQHFGTIFVDLERRCVVDVLAVRTADAVATWLAAHPSTTTISRDRYPRTPRVCAAGRRKPPR